MGGEIAPQWDAPCLKKTCHRRDQVPTEIERKFLVTGTEWRQTKSICIQQGYLCRGNGKTVRIRLAGEKAFLTIKGSREGITRAEFEYEIPFGEGEELLTLCDDAIIEKKRHVVKYKGFKWEVDEFQGENEGLVVAEIELDKEDQQFERPGWVGQEVTGDTRYYNANLVSNPYCTWSERGGGG
jgi:CYTH domain-containing protein